MKKKFFIGLALLAAVVVMAQQIKKPSAPPAPAPVKAKTNKVPPPPVEPPPPPTVPPPPPPPTEPPPPPPKVELPAPAAPDEDLPQDYKDFMKRNPGVKNFGWKLNNEVIIYLRNGKKEIYDLDNTEQKAKLESKYGKLPAPPPLPPPPPARN